MWWHRELAWEAGDEEVGGGGDEKPEAVGCAELGCPSESDESCGAADVFCLFSE